MSGSDMTQRVGGSKVGFQLLLIVSFISRFGDQLLYVALPLLFLQETGSAGLAIASISVRSIPYLVAPLLGELIDRFGTRQVYFYAQIIQLLAIGAIPLVASQPVWALILLTVSGIGSALASLLDYFKLVPQLVSDEKLESAIGTYSAVTSAARLIAPLIGGALVLFAGARTAIYVDALTFGVTALAVLWILPNPPAPPKRGNVLASLREGFQYFRAQRELQLLASSMAMMNLGIGVLGTLILTLYTHRFGFSVQTATLLISAGALCSIVGSKASQLGMKGRPMPTRVLIWQALTALGTVLLVMPSISVKSAGYLLVMFAVGASNVITIAYRRTTIPEQLQGRVNANIRMLITGAIPVSGLIHGYFATHAAQLDPMLLVAVLGCISFVIWAFSVRRAEG